MNGEFYGLVAKLIAKVGFQAGIVSHCEVSDVPIFHDNEAGLATAVKTVRIGQELACDATVDPELLIGGELEHHLIVTVRVKHVGELPGRILDS